ncbi:MAG: hypothetical protein HQK52_23555 [Oligoflexia bacterium]|nr:hypothetical protein [Oligoflexia bacterium]
MGGIGSKLVEFSDEILMFANRMQRDEVSSCTLSIGFPFPIETRDCKINGLKCKSYSLMFFIRGAYLRKLQREELQQTLVSISSETKWSEVDVELFREKVATYLLNQKKCLYIDPYNNGRETLMGNSIIGLRFLDSFLKEEQAKEIKVISNSSEHLKLFFDVVAKQHVNYDEEIRNSDYVIIPDLIDNRWKITIEQIMISLKHGKTCFILGRNLIVTKTSNRVHVYHCEGDDPLLVNKGVDLYIEDCLRPFFKEQTKFRQKLLSHEASDHGDSENKRNTIFINPFSSTELRDLPVDLVETIACNLVKNGYRIVVSAGVPGSDKDFNWITSFKYKLNDIDRTLADSIEILPAFINLTELGHRLSDLGVIGAVTPDTSIAHFLARLSILNITLVRMRFWDTSSIQALSTVFVRTSRYQIPVLYWEQCAVDTLADVSCQLMSIFLQTDKKQLMLATLTDVYNEFLKINEVMLTLTDREGSLYEKSKNTRWVVDWFKNAYARYRQMTASMGLEALFDSWNVEELLKNVETDVDYLNLLYYFWRVSPSLKFLQNIFLDKTIESEILFTHDVR